MYVHLRWLALLITHGIAVVRVPGVSRGPPEGLVPAALVTARGRVLEGGRRLTRLLILSRATLPLH
eukprot:7625585-Lingulodinium_polyedra.AAC.1